ncbi:dihydroneopterin aldolase [Lentilactobacillus sp. Marseille-Q4993]|uniref:dihydroneopterin aldolase n=1 Tax=Lentilactobacillus sp. Marseille-Q4993 TaxID=3039492 RepID=UPI0024BD517A|nr:dihydroneopterin aldolase [Lentilactobacillus sp. Marseille-Q4993]
MYYIRLNNLRFHSHLGVLPEEKVVGQNIEIDVEIKVNATVSNDDITTTVSYADMPKIIQSIVTESRVNLLETLAQTIIDRLKATDSRIAGIRVKIRKQNLPLDVGLDNVEIEVSD